MPLTLTPSAVSGESVVNQSTDGYQAVFAVKQMLDADGNPNGQVLFLWYDSELNQTIGQFYSMDGSDASAEFVLQADTNSATGWPDIVAHPGGSFTVVWTEFRSYDPVKDLENHDILMQRFNADGSAMWDEAIQVNEVSFGSQVFARAVAVGDFAIAVAFHSHNNPDDNNIISAYTRLVEVGTDTGTLLASEIQLNENLDADRVVQPQVVALADGGYAIQAVSFTDHGDDLSNTVSEMLIWTFNADGTSRGDPVSIDEGTSFDGGFFSPAVLSNGTVVYAWRSDDGGRYSFRIFEADGVTPITDVITPTLPFDTHGGLFRPQVEALADGSFVIAFIATANGWDDVTDDVFVQRFSADGSPLGGTILVEDDANIGDAAFVQVVAFEGGGFTVGWSANQSDDLNDQDYDIYSRTFRTPEAFIEGTDGDDVIRGTTGATDVDAGNGNDAVWAGPGDFGSDQVYGGDGNDTLGLNAGDDLGIGGDGEDVIFGGSGNDTVLGGDWDDKNQNGVIEQSELSFDDAANVLWTGAGDDVVRGAHGNDTIGGGTGGDDIYGHDGDDIIYGGKGDGNDYVNGGAGNDLVFGGQGNDQVLGGDGSDTLYGGAGNDLVKAGNGNDQVYGGPGDDTLFGGNGNDVFYFNAQTGEDVVSDFDVDDDTLFLANTATDFQSVDDVEAATSEVDGGILIDTGNGNSVFFEGLSLSDLSDIDFVF